MLEAPPQPAVPQLARVNVAAFLDTGGGGRAMEITPNGAKALVIGVRRLLIIDTLTGKTLHTVSVPNFENAHLSVHPGGRIAVITDQHVRGMRFWDTETGDQLREFMEAMGPHRIAPDGRHIAYADGDKLLIYDTIANRAVSAPASHNREPLARIAVSTDGSKLATLTSRGTLTLWNVLISETDRSYVLSRVASADTRIEHKEARSVEFSAASDAIWTASDAMLVRWSLSTHVAGVESSRAGLMAAETVPMGNVRGQGLKRIPGSEILVLTGSHAQQGSYLLFYDTVKKSAAVLEVERNYYPSVSLSADGHLLFTSTVHELRRRDAPTSSEYVHADAVLGPLLPPTPASKSAVIGPILKNLPADLLTEIVGVYEGGGQQVQSVQTSSGLRSARAVTVGVGRTDRPLALVLASYEPVIWDLNIVKDARIVHVLVSGLYESLVRGAENVQVTRIGTAHTHIFGDQGFTQLQQQIRQYTGKGVDGFQGAYRGIRFSLGIGAPKEVASAGDPQGLGPHFPSNIPLTADMQTTSRWTASSAKGPAYGSVPDGQLHYTRDRPRGTDTRAFAEKLYDVSAYTSEAAVLGTLTDAELDLVASRWLAQKLAASRGRPPARAPARWEEMIAELRRALAPLAESHLRDRERALSASGLNGKAAFVREYERLLRTPTSRDNIQFTDGQPPSVETKQTEDIPDILAFHETRAAAKWRGLWPELRAHAARLAALHYRVDADAALGGPSRDWNERAKALLRASGGKVLTPAEWQEMANGRLGFTLRGLDRFLLPLGTEMRQEGLSGSVMSIQEKGHAVVITQHEGRGLAFRLLDARWERDIARRLSPSELQQIDDALTASYVKKKGRWFAPLELEWNAYLSISRQLRSAREMQQVYQSFAARSDVAMADVWARWQ
jgi:hypothetical protein